VIGVTAHPGVVMLFFPYRHVWDLPLLVGGLHPAALALAMLHVVDYCGRRLLASARNVATFARDGCLAAL